MLIERITFLLVPSEKAMKPESYSYLPPLSIGTLGGYLNQKGYAVMLYDLNTVGIDSYSDDIEDYHFIYNKDMVLSYIAGEIHSEVERFMEYLLRDIPLEDRQIVGISCGADFSLFQLHSAFLLAKYIERKYKVPVVIGGNNITYLTSFKDIYKELIEEVLKNFHYIMKGPGAIVWAEFLDILNGRSDKDVKELDGMVYLHGDEIIENPEQDPCIVRPDWLNLKMEPYYVKVKEVTNGKEEVENEIHIFKWPYYLTKYVNDVRKKQNKEGFLKTLVLPYIFNYNCPYACAFCSESDEKRKRVIMGEVDKVVEDLIYLSNKYHTNYFYFLNNAVNASPKFLDELCKQLIACKADLKWSDCARFNNMTYERLSLMKRAGCRKLVFGFETASLKLIDLVEKNIDLNHAEQVMEWCYELGIFVDLEVIIGLPQENDDDFNATIEYITKNKKKINYLAINEFFVVPNSKIGRYPDQYGIKLIRNIITYEKILKTSQKGLRDTKLSHAANFKLYKYNEVNGRSYREISEKNKVYLRYINGLQNKEFDEVEYVHRIIERKC